MNHPRIPSLAVGGLAALLAGAPAYAQHEHHPPAQPPPAAPPPTPSPSPMAMHDHAAPSPSPSPTLFDSDMARMTGMTPRDPMAGMAMPSWSFMTMGVVRLQYNHQGGPSGDEAVESSNWGMAMAQRDLAGGRLTLMMMSSLEPATFPEGGTPELFQTGEAFRGQALVDRQHPHDLFMNLSATYRRPVGEGAVWLQLAPVGEPALGPVAFMHRASAGENPTSPLGHHWIDSTHITNSVVTVGGGRGRASVEVSTFHGREPDEHRWNVDGGAPDSVSARVKVAFGRGWSSQASYGFIKDAEELAPGDLRRTTISVHYGEEGDRPLALSLVWGRNDEDHGVSNALLAEGAWQATARDQLYARAERVQKDAELLAEKHLHADDAGDDETVPVGALTLGYARRLGVRGSLNLAIGADLTLYRAPTRLREAYGDHPASLHVFARLRWGRPHGAHGGHGH
jgi:hypothetical protein